MAFLLLGSRSPKNSRMFRNHNHAFPPLSCQPSISDDIVWTAERRAGLAPPPSRYYKKCAADCVLPTKTGDESQKAVDQNQVREKANFKVDKKCYTVIEYNMGCSFVKKCLLSNTFLRRTYSKRSHKKRKLLLC